MTDARDSLPFEGIIRSLLDTRRWSPEGRSILELALHSGVRTRANWLVPTLGGLAAVGALFLFRTSKAAEDGFFAVFGRIFLFDYMLFLFGWVSGWNMSRRWRENPELIEELTLTPIRPAHTLLAASSGLLGVWAYVVAGLFVAEMVFFFVGKFMQIPTDGGWGAKDALGLFIDTSVITVIALPALGALAVFHFQSVRLAHAMFALGALPRVRLGALAMNNFMLIAAYVVVLSMVGCMLAGIVWIPLAIVGSAMRSGSTMFGGDVAVEMSWLLASIPALAAVGMMKAKVARDFAVQFGRRWAMFIWWGAAELEHPVPYPQNYEAAATSWALHQVAEEMNNAPGASETMREKARRDYIRSLGLVNALRPGAPQPPPLYRRAGEPPRMAAPPRIDGLPPGPFQSPPREAPPPSEAGRE